MWIAFALLAALAAGATAILAKIGMEGVDSTLATALRTVVVAVFAWLLVFGTGAWRGIGSIDGRSFGFLVASGLATGASWLCYFRALVLGEVSRVAVVDRTSTVIAMVFAVLFLGEPFTWPMGAAMALVAVGSYLVVAPARRRGGEGATARPAVKASRAWLPWAIGSAVFAALTAILGKTGVEGVDSNLGAAIRTLVVLVAAWALALALGKQRQIRSLTRRNWLFIAASGIATGVSWLAFYRALQDGPVSAVAPIDKLSILVTVAFAVVVLRERLTRREVVGLALLTAGSLMTLIRA